MCGSAAGQSGPWVPQPGGKLLNLSACSCGFAMWSPTRLNALLPPTGPHVQHRHLKKSKGLLGTLDWQAKSVRLQRYACAHQMLHMPQRIAGSPITCCCSGWAMCQFTHSLIGSPSLPPHLTGDVHAVVWADPVPGGLRLHLPEAGQPLCAQRPQAHHPAGWPAATLNACHPAAAPSGAAAQARGSPQAAARQGPPAAAAHAAAPAPPAAGGTCPCDPAAGGTAGGRR